MKVARIKDRNVKETYGIISDDGKSIATRSEIQQQTGIPLPPNIKDFVFRGWLDEVKQHKTKLKFNQKVSDIELMVPIPNPPKIICLAFNYYDHARDAGLTPSEEPVIFIKPRTALNSPHGEVISPSNVKKISEEESLDAVFGYMVFHDVSARDIQFRDKQFTRGKSIDTFAPCGPWITTKDEIHDPQKLRITTKVNGELRQ